MPILKIPVACSAQVVTLGSRKAKVISYIKEMEFEIPEINYSDKDKLLSITEPEPYGSKKITINIYERNGKIASKRKNNAIDNRFQQILENPNLYKKLMAWALNITHPIESKTILGEVPDVKTWISNNEDTLYKIFKKHLSNINFSISADGDYQMDPEYAFAIRPGVEKTRSRLINDNHPLITRYPGSYGFEKHDEKITPYDIYIPIVCPQTIYAMSLLTHTDTFLQRNAEYELFKKTDDLITDELIRDTVLAATLNLYRSINITELSANEIECFLALKKAIDTTKESDDNIIDNLNIVMHQYDGFIDSLQNEDIKNKYGENRDLCKEIMKQMILERVEKNHPLIWSHNLRENKINTDDMDNASVYHP